MLGGHDATDPAQVIVAQIRLPRAVAAVVIGAALAVSGLIMQAVARNPLADPGLTGVTAGAALAVVGGLWGIGALSQGIIAGPALLGAGVSAIVGGYWRAERITACGCHLPGRPLPACAWRWWPLWCS
jgi:iron complex transport system permease protein